MLHANIAQVVFSIGVACNIIQHYCCSLLEGNLHVMAHIYLVFMYIVLNFIIIIIIIIIKSAVI